MTIRRYFILLLILICLPGYALAGNKPATPEMKRVLVLYSQEKGHPAHDLTDQGIRSGFAANPDFDVKLYTEYLDTGRFPTPDHASLSADYLRRKYADLKFDAIIAVYPAAMDFLLSEGRGLFPGVPVVACETSRSAAEKLDQSPERRFITGVILGDNATDIITSALNLKADTRHVALIAGTTTNDAYSEQILRRGLKPFLDRLDLIDLTKLSLEETLVRVRSLPPRTIVLYSTIFIDGAGKRLVPQQALTQISRAANAPVFGLYESYFGHGIVGGRLISFDRQGRLAAGQALRILAGASPATIPFGGDDAYATLYDWRELKRWNIPLATIPAGAEIRFRKLTLWEQYRWFVIGAVSLTIIETLLILILFINLKRRKKAERELAESRMRLNLAVESADAGLWSLDMNTGRIWATDQTLMMYGFMPGETVDRVRFLSIVHADDQERVVQAMADAVQDRTPFNLEYRIRLPDGSIRWMAVRGSYIPSPAGLSGLTGVSVDITERKKTEEELRQSAKELSRLMGRLISTQENERSHIARELHDDITQRLAVLAIEVGALELQFDPGQQHYREKLHDIKASLVSISEDIHAVSRQLHPSILDDLGLVRALEAEMARFSEKEGIKVLFNHEKLPADIPRDIGLALYRVTQEGLRNIARHSRATSAHIELKGQSDSIYLTIADTGCGFDPGYGRQKPGLGLVSMKERIELVNGSITIDSTPGEGTIISVSIPCAGDPT